MHSRLRLLVAPLLAALSITIVGRTASAQAPLAADSPCFEIVASHGDRPAGAILLNRCTGQTWILTRAYGKHSVAVAFRWTPIATGGAAPANSPPARRHVRLVIKPQTDKCFIFKERRYCE